jgi:hypothetical protein
MTDLACIKSQYVLLMRWAPDDETGAQPAMSDEKLSSVESLIPVTLEGAILVGAEQH